MFTGIIECTALVENIEKEGSNYNFTLSSPLVDEIKIDQSMAHDGVCLTVVKIDKENKTYVVTAMEETMLRSNLGSWKVGSKINIERAMKNDSRFDGHIVQGHVDQKAVCTKVEVLDGSWRFYFEYDEKEHFTVEKGSVCINGVSLTVVDSKKGMLSVAIIPYTYHETNFCQIKEGSEVNLEFDILGKYIKRLFDEYRQSL